MANGIAFAAPLRKIPQALDASAPSDNDSGRALSPRPAVLSRAVVQRELRERVGFRGVTITDDLAAPAFAAHGGQPGAAVGAARAGVDLLLFAGTYEDADGAAQALESAIRERRVDRAELEDGTARILALRQDLR